MMLLAALVFVATVAGIDVANDAVLLLLMRSMLFLPFALLEAHRTAATTATTATTTATSTNNYYYNTTTRTSTTTRS